MIPRIIHYCWFGKGQKTNLVEKCISSWKQVLPNYEIKEWNENNFDVNILPYTREAYALKKYAFVSDVARLYALMNEGGIYLDTDVRVIKSFDPYLSYHSFIGKQNPLKVGTACIGSECNQNWISEFYKQYEHIHFITRSGKLNQLANTDRLSIFLNLVFPLYYDKEIKVFDVDYFSARICKDNAYYITDKTVCIHEFANSWGGNKLTINQRIENIFKRIKCNWL
ncbi:MAG: glycosyl transferase [Paludibacteraceae bacterium]|nr:glycosyl transferase [Paludibacteraceae bacterium]